MVLLYHYVAFGDIEKFLWLFIKAVVGETVRVAHVVEYSLVIASHRETTCQPDPISGDRLRLVTASGPTVYVPGFESPLCH